MFSEVNPNFLNGKNEVEFTLGFVYDGYKEYRNLEKNADPTLQALSKLYVYDDPKIQTFVDSFGNEVFVSNVKHSFPYCL